jgi:small-conductance mechanosensitive channel
MNELLKRLTSDQELSIISILPKFLGIMSLILTITIYWVLFNFTVRWLARNNRSTTVFSWQRILLTFITISVTVITLVIAFIDNLPLFFGSLSLLSAAFVFALQDFVSCFFAWIYIETSRQYKVNDIILITTDTRTVYGMVSEIGLFRSIIVERMGGDINNLDREMTTGRTVSFPNNYIFKHSLTNITKNHKVLFHRFKIIITFESDFELANSLIEQSMNSTFLELMQKPDKYFDLQMNDLNSLKPHTFQSIEDSGVAFTVWFGCRVGTLRLVLQKYSLKLLKVFKENNIELAYTTFRVTKS